ncbi:MAG: phosphoribosylglycinamide formyltransferase [Clostridiales bacterium]|jgi:phosphoribosylglycinamide formyltransferase-1|nr:phosphoribosylglycinamide formyltransferase [Clostridiales bacterium]
MLKIAVLVSGGGTNLQALINAGLAEYIAVTISNKSGVKALERAEAAGIETVIIADENQLLRELKTRGIGLVVLAGYLAILRGEVLEVFKNRIINVHPSLIPLFCGEGMYGLKVHEAALAAGVRKTGATVHYVNEIVDGGAILAQKEVDVLEGDTPEILQKRVMEQAEWVILPMVVRKFIEEDEKLSGGN